MLMPTKFCHRSTRLVFKLLTCDDLLQTHQNKIHYAAIMEEEPVEPVPDYDLPASKNIPVAPPLPDFLLKRTIRL